MIKNETFEATYTRYDFAPLVRIGVAIAAMISGRRAMTGTDDRSDRSVGGALGSAA